MRIYIYMRVCVCVYIYTYIHICMCAKVNYWLDFNSRVNLVLTAAI